MRCGMLETDRTYADIEETLRYVYSERARFIALAVRYVGSRAEAEDIFQHCAVDMMKAMRNGNAIADPRAYFARAVKNRCRRYLQHRDYEKGMKALMAEELEYLSHLDNYEDDRKLDCGALLRSCRDKLPELTFEVYGDKKFNGLDYKTIARKFNITERRVNTEIQKAQKVFREEFWAYSLKYILTLFIAVFHNL